MKRSLFGQIYYYFTILILLSILGVGIVSYIYSSRALSDQVERYIRQLIQHSSSQTEAFFRRYELVSDSILSEQLVKQFMELDPEDHYEFYQLTTIIRKSIFYKVFIAYPDIYSITVIGDHGKAILEDNQNGLRFQNFDALETLRSINSIIPQDGKIAIFKTDWDDGWEEKITIARRIRGYTSYEPKGVLIMEIRTDSLVPLWDLADMGEQTSFLIIDENGNIVYEHNVAGMPMETRKAVIADVQHRPDVSVVKDVNGVPTLFVGKESSYLRWIMIASLPVNVLQKPISVIRTATIFVGFVTLLFALILAYRFGRSITRPIRTVMEGMRETERGIWSRLEDQGRNDELSGLIQRYNLMVSRLSEMIDRVYEAELKQQKYELELQRSRFERQQAEFQALQLQIHPHFLYNTLETINCYAIVKESEEISEIVEAMAFMLRYSVQTHLEEIAVANELNHVRNYMVIMQHRLGKDFEIEVTIPPELLLHNMVRLTLQPLVENALQHAFPEGLKPHHYIRIGAEEQENDWCIYVEDNGIGMAKEQMDELRRRLNETEPEEERSRSLLRRGGIGLVNVHRRIRIVYGEEYGLKIDSLEEHGSRFSLHMPKKGKAGNDLKKTQVQTAKLH